MSMIEVESIAKSYGDVTAVEDVTLSIDRGEVYGILGPNGAGKTTTINMITGQTTPDGGSIRVCGVDPVANPVEARSHLGILPERESPPSFLTPREYFTLVGDLRDMSHSEVEDRAEEWGNRLDFTEQLDTLNADLSRGQQQKVMITQALMHEPDVVIIDEPLVNLDPIIQERVKNLITDYGSYARAVLLSTHDISVAHEVCREVGIINNGQLVTEQLIGHTESPADLLELFEDITSATAFPDGHPAENPGRRGRRHSGGSNRQRTGTQRNTRSQNPSR